VSASGPWASRPLASVCQYPAVRCPDVLCSTELDCAFQRDGQSTNYLCRLTVPPIVCWEEPISVSIASGYGLDEDDRGSSFEFRVSIPGSDKRIFPLASVSRPAPTPTQPPVQWVPGVLSLGLKPGRGVTLTTHPHLVPR
jgi:hypothetical protein